jgi:hypothetical protein
MVDSEITSQSIKLHSSICCGFWTASFAAGGPGIALVLTPVCEWVSWCAVYWYSVLN